MKKLLSFILCFGFVFSPFAQAKNVNKTMNLRECYEAALKQSERIPISDEEIKQAQARFTQALGLVLPKVMIKLSELLQDPSQSGTQGSSFANTFTRFSTPQAAINMVQPIFHGLQEIYAMKRARTTISQKKYNQQNVERLLYRDVAISYYTIAQIEMNLRTNQKILETVRRQLTDLKKRIDLGKSRNSELSAQEAVASLLEANIERNKGDEKVAYDMLSFLTGLDPHPPIDMRELFDEKLKPIDYYITQVDHRPDVEVARKAVEIAQSSAKITRGALLPQMDLTANYYPYRVGFQKDIHWDATVTMNIPVFNFAIFGELKEMNSKTREAWWQAHEVKRLAVTDVKKAYDAYRASLSTFKKYNIASTKSEKSYYEQTQDFNLNLINNLDVLQTQRTWFDALRATEDARVQVWLDWFNLQIAAGVQ